MYTISYIFHILQNIVIILCVAYVAPITVLPVAYYLLPLQPVTTAPGPFVGIPRYAHSGGQHSHPIPSASGPGNTFVTVQYRYV